MEGQPSRNSRQRKLAVASRMRNRFQPRV